MARYPYYWTTDVNAAGWAEYVSGSAADVDNIVYLTVGTGVGAGIIANGQLVGGYSTSEAGHIMMAKQPCDHYAGHCPFHGDHCLEGLQLDLRKSAGEFQRKNYLMTT